MRYTTKTEYGLICLSYMAREGGDRVTSIHDLVQSEEMSITYVEKIFQNLRNAGIVTSHQGKKGGYSLAKKPTEITVKEVIEALEGSTFDVFCVPDVRKDMVCTHSALCGLGPVWQRTKELLDKHFSSVTLEDLLHEEKKMELGVAE